MTNSPLGRIGTCVLVLVLLAACVPFSTSSTPTPAPLAPDGTPKALVPDFAHIVIVMFENKAFGSVIGNPLMPGFNKLAREQTLLTQYYAIGRPSLPNYIGLISGGTYGIDTNCAECFVDAVSLPDLIEASGRTWRTYQEDMPERCFFGDADLYAQKHNPFIYFDPIRLDEARCRKSIVPLDRLQVDIKGDALPNFVFISPNLCNDSHDCSLDVTDAWLAKLLDGLLPALDAAPQSYLLVLMFDEDEGEGACCGPPPEAGGRVPVILYSPLARSGFEDATPYNHYSLLKTISTGWGLPLLGHAADDANTLITKPWK